MLLAAEGSVCTTHQAWEVAQLNHATFKLGKRAIVKQVHRVARDDSKELIAAKMHAAEIGENCSMVLAESNIREFVAQVMRGSTTSAGGTPASG